MNRSVTRTAALIALMLGAISAHAALFQIYTEPRFGGAEMQLFGETPDARGLTPFSEQAASLVVEGRWEVCNQPEYRGDCVIIGTGRYPTIDPRLYRRIQSFRPLALARAEDDRRLGRDQPPPPPPPLVRPGPRDLPPPPMVRPREVPRMMPGWIDLYPSEGYRGSPLRISGSSDTLREYSDRTSSIVVHRGIWEMCTEPGFRGRCETFEPGRYPSLGRLDNRISSVRQVR